MLPNPLRLILKILWNLFAIIGLLVVAGGLYLYFADPFHLRALLTSSPAPLTATTLPTTTDSGAGNPAPTPAVKPTLTPQQESAARSLGLDPSRLANFLTPQTEACATTALGSQRVAELKAGATPTPIDLIKAGHCIK